MKNSQKGFSILEVLLIITVIGIVGIAGMFVWNRSKDTETDNKISEAATETAAETIVEEKPVSTDDQVIASVEAYCNAIVDSTTKKPLVLTVGTAGEAQKKVLYSADKKFAYVNAVCGSGDTNEAEEASGSAYVLKNVNDTWVFLYRGQDTNEEAVKMFNIPSITEFN